MIDTLVLCYHAVSDTFPAALSVTPDRLEEQLRTLAGRGYRGVTCTDAITHPAGKQVAVTFDDGFRSVLDLGLPMLARLGWVATLFAPTDFVGSERPMCWPGIDGWLESEHARELMPLSWAQLGELAQAGWEIGSHTCSHPRLTSIADDQLASELQRSRDALQSHMGRPCTSLAYPYGDWNARVAQAAEAAGYTVAVTLPGARHRASALSWPRVGVYHGDDRRRFALKASPVVRRVRWRTTRLALAGA